MTDVHGSRIEVKLRDGSSFSVYYKGKAVISDPKDMKRLLDDLQEKGVSFEVGWFE